jgi:hypothetical protein
MPPDLMEGWARTVAAARDREIRNRNMFFGITQEGSWDLPTVYFSA